MIFVTQFSKAYTRSLQIERDRLRRAFVRQQTLFTLTRYISTKCESWGTHTIYVRRPIAIWRYVSPTLCGLGGLAHDDQVTRPRDYESRQSCQAFSASFIRSQLSTHHTPTLTIRLGMSAALWPSKPYILAMLAPICRSSHLETSYESTFCSYPPTSQERVHHLTDRENQKWSID